MRVSALSLLLAIKVCCHTVCNHNSLSHYVSEIREKHCGNLEVKIVHFCLSPAVVFLSHKHTQPAALAVLTDEPRVGGQAGLVIVLVGAGAHCVGSYPAVHQVISQPRPAAQTGKRKRDRGSVIKASQMNIQIHKFKAMWA